MAIEIERKFLISSIPPGCPAPRQIRQGYLHNDPSRSVRIRIIEEQSLPPSAYLTIKGPTSAGHFSRHEFEYAIPPQDAIDLLKLCKHDPIEKKRYLFPYGGHLWELDQFEGKNTGLLMAEIELENEKTEFACPPFLEKEVTSDPRYFNLQLAIKPYTTWETNK